MLEFVSKKDMTRYTFRTSDPNNLYMKTSAAFALDLGRIDGGMR
jgi:hypothetical protein